MISMIVSSDMAWSELRRVFLQSAAGRLGQFVHQSSVPKRNSRRDLAADNLRLIGTALRHYAG